MPTCAWPPETRTHSWSFVYFRSDGYILLPLYGTEDPASRIPNWIPDPDPASRSLRALVERHRYHLRARAAATHVDVELRAGRRAVRGQVGHADRFLQERGLRAARDDACLRAVHVCVVAVPRDRAIDHFEPHQLPRCAIGFLLLQHVAAEELRLLPPDNPSEIGFDDGRRLVHVVAEQA